jgi:hypothetical protein
MYDCIGAYYAHFLFHYRLPLRISVLSFGLYDALFDVYSGMARVSIISPGKKETAVNDVHAGYGEWRTE